MRSSPRAIVRLLSLWAPVGLYMALIFYTSSQSDVSLPQGLPDKPVHSITYTGLAITVVRALAGGLPARVTRRVAVYAVLITVAYGVSDEVHQMSVPERTPEFGDLYADFVGACLGTAACWAWGIISTPHR